jgi:glycosyltransferase involved in cell wall biosynthesis
MKYSVVIPTYNRATDLRDTLGSLAEIHSPGSWEVIVVDNNSTDGTPETIAAVAAAFPVELRYVHEPVQGISAALNAGIGAASGELIAITNDDHRYDRDWLISAGEGIDRFGGAYVGGRILPLWQSPAPSWVSLSSARQRAVLALADYGSGNFEFGATPVLGGNMVVRREVFERAGLWNPDIGRKPGTLLGQEQREWCIRVHRAGLRGYYVPEMLVYHLVPGGRLTRKYFYRWFYWHGISRAMLYRSHGLDMEAPERAEVDFSSVPHVAGVPRYLYRTALKTMDRMLRASVRGDTPTAFEELLWLCYFAGVVRQRWKDRVPTPSAGQPQGQSASDAQ